MLHQIETHKIRSLIIDMSGVVCLDTMVVQHLFKILDGISYMGCTAIITGIRAEIANTMVNLGISLNDRIETKRTLQQALEELRLPDHQYITYISCAKRYRITGGGWDPSRNSVPYFASCTINLGKLFSFFQTSSAVFRGYRRRSIWRTPVTVPSAPRSNW